MQSLSLFQDGRRGKKGSSKVATFRGYQDLKSLDFSNNSRSQYGYLKSGTLGRQSSGMLLRESQETNQRSSVDINNENHRYRLM